MKLARIACAGLLLLAGGAAAQDGGKTRRYGHYQNHDQPGNRDAGRRLSALWQCLCGNHERRRSALSIEPRNTKGSNENIPLLESDQLDIALVAGEPSYEAFMGIGRAPTKLKILTAMYSSPGMFVVRADSPYKTIRDLVGQPVAFGAKGSGLPILSRYMLDGIGLKQDEDFKSIYLDRAGDGPAMVQDGRAAALWGAGIGWPGFAAMAQAPGGARFIAPDAERDRAHPRQAHVPQAADGPGRQLSEPDRRRSIRSAPGVLCSRAKACPMTSPTGWRARCTGSRPRSARSCRRPARPRPRTRSPPRRTRS